MSNLRDYKDVGVSYQRAGVEIQVTHLPEFEGFLQALVRDLVAALERQKCQSWDIRDGTRQGLKGRIRQTDAPVQSQLVKLLQGFPDCLWT